MIQNLQLNNTDLNIMGSIQLIDPTDYQGPVPVYTQNVVTYKMTFEGNFAISDAQMIVVYPTPIEITSLDLSGIGTRSSSIYVPTTLIILPRKNWILAVCAECRGSSTISGAYITPGYFTITQFSDDRITLTSTKTHAAFAFGQNQTSRKYPCCITSGRIFG